MGLFYLSIKFFIQFIYIKPAWIVRAILKKYIREKNIYIYMKFLTQHILTFMNFSLFTFFVFFKKLHPKDQGIHIIFLLQGVYKLYSAVFILITVLYLSKMIQSKTCYFFSQRLKELRTPCKSFMEGHSKTFYIFMNI